MRTRRVEWNGMEVDAARPAPLADWRCELSTRTVRETERAAAALQRFGDRAVGAAEVAARLLLRSEGVASSAIEGLRAPAVEVALAEAGGTSDPAGVAFWVADNLAVVSDALSAPAPGARRSPSRHAG